MYRIIRTDEELDEMAIADAVRSFITLQARDLVRRKRNELLPKVMAEIDKARALGDKPDVPAILRAVYNHDLEDAAERLS
jgi:hypothetical protein